MVTLGVQSVVCVYAHVARRRPWLAATCASRRSEITCRVSTSAAASESPQTEHCRLQHRPCYACFKPRSAQRDGRARAGLAQFLPRQHAAVRASKRVSKLSSPTAAPRNGRFAPRHRPFLTPQATAATPRPADGGAAQISPARNSKSGTTRTPTRMCNFSPQPSRGCTSTYTLNNNAGS